jgi:hypothetical protein
MFGSRAVSAYLAGKAAADVAEDGAEGAAEGGGFGLFRLVAGWFREAPAAPSTPVSYGTGVSGFSSLEDYHAAIANTIKGVVADAAEDAGD